MFRPLHGRYHWDLDEDVLLSGVKALEDEQLKPNFGNAGSVNNLLSMAAVRLEQRVKGLPPIERAWQQPISEDFLPAKKGQGDAREIFSSLIGCRCVYFGSGYDDYGLLTYNNLW